MTDEDVLIEKGPRFRSPPYPAIGLGKAIDRAVQLFTKAQHFGAGIAVISEAWGLSPQSGGPLKIAAALIHYGLLTDSGTGNGRKFQLTDIARRIVRDTDPSSEKRVKAIQAAALNPMIHKELWGKFGSSQKISDLVLKNHLILDRVDEGLAAYSDAAAVEVIQNYREAINYAKLSDDIQESDEVSENASSLDQIEKEGFSNTPFNPQSQAEQGSKSSGHIVRNTPALLEYFALLGSRETEIKVMLDGDIIRVSAIVDAKAIRKLIKILNANLALMEDDD